MLKLQQEGSGEKFVCERDGEPEDLNMPNVYPEPIVEQRRGRQPTLV